MKIIIQMRHIKLWESFNSTSESNIMNKCDSHFDFGSLKNYTELTKPLYSIIAKGKYGKLVYMKPKQYIYAIANGFGGLSYADVAESSVVSKGKISKYVDDMRNGDKFPIGYYTKYGEMQEGRHRALAALELGCEKIPVVEIIELNQSQILKVVNKLKDMTREELNVFMKNSNGTNFGISGLCYRELQSYITYRL